VSPGISIAASGRLALRFGQQCERRARRENTDGAKWVQGEQVLITGDDDGGVGREGAGEHVVIIGISTHRSDRDAAY